MDFLVALVFSPLLAMLLIALVPKTQEKTLKLVGIAGTVPATIMALTLYASGQYDQVAVAYEWLNFGNFQSDLADWYKVGFELGVNGFSTLLIVLTAVLATLASIASIHIKKEWKGYFLLFFLLELGMLGVFAAQNLILFFIFFELTLIAMFFLVGKWGYFEKEKAAFSFLVYNGIGSAILLIVIMVLFGRTGTTNLAILQEMVNDPQLLSNDFKMGIVIALLVAFGIKLPIFPLHRWMVHVHVEAPPSIVMLHAGVLLKIGAYGLIRFGYELFPGQLADLSLWIAILGVVNLLYGAFLALIQTDLKKVLAYSSISHMGIVLIGLAAMNEAGVQGAIFQVISHGLIAALLFFLIGVMYERTKTTDMDALGGLAKAMPLTAGFMLAGAMASLGMPGMSGFVSEFMAFLGLFEQQPIIAAIGTLGIILTAVYLLRAFLNVTFGKREQGYGAISDMSATELVPALVLIGFIVLIGVYPTVLSEPLMSTVATIVEGIGG